MNRTCPRRDFPRRVDQLGYKGIAGASLQTNCTNDPCSIDSNGAVGKGGIRLE